MDPAFFEKMQPPKFKETYGRCMACELDGTTVVHDKSRVHSVRARCSYCDKCKHQAGQGLTWTSCIGLVLLVTSLFCGRTSEKALVQLHTDWLWIFPHLMGQLLDRGFTGVRRWYPTRLVSYHPAKVQDRKKGGVDLTTEQVIDSAVQAADRYTSEVVYSRVKVFDILQSKCAFKFLPYITTGWYVGHMFAQFYKPLREPTTWKHRQTYLDDAMALAPLSHVDVASFIELL